MVMESDFDSLKGKMMAVTEDHILEELKKVIDPELFVNIVESWTDLRS